MRDAVIGELIAGILFIVGFIVLLNVGEISIEMGVPKSFVYSAINTYMVAMSIIGLTSFITLIILISKISK
jgi:hypothetical protein